MGTPSINEVQYSISIPTELCVSASRYSKRFGEDAVLVDMICPELV